MDDYHQYRLDPLTQAIVDQAVEQTASRVLKGLGIDTDNPLEVQKDMACLGKVRQLFNDKEFLADLDHLHAMRLLSTMLRNKGVLVTFGILMSGMAAMIWLGVKEAVK